MLIQIAIQDADKKEVEQIQRIFEALIRTGGLTGVRGGQTIIHFDNNGDFRGIQLSYWPWKEKA